MTVAIGSMTFLPDGDLADFDALVGKILTDRSTDERVAELDAQPGVWDEDLYQTMISSGVISALVGDRDEAGLGAQGMYLLAKQAGRTLQRTPLIPSAVLALASFRAGNSDLAEEIANGQVRVAICDPTDLESVALADRLTGTCGYVTHGAMATHFLVLTDDDRAVLVPASADGVTIATTGWGYTEDVSLTFNVSAVQADVLDGVPASTIRAFWRMAVAALVAGAGAEAVARTAQYVSERHQFGAPLSTKQGVAHRAADAHIDGECITLTTLQSAVLLDDAQASVSARHQASLEAAWWAATGGVRIVHATQHLHGGMGADTDNHIHRFFTFVRGLAMTLGPEDRLLEALGSALVENIQRRTQ